MDIRDLTPAARHLRKGEILRLGAARGRRVESIHGGLWITMDHDVRDVVLGTGEGFTIDGDGEALVSALDDASVVVLAPSVPPGGHAARGDATAAAP
jgi:hypothetical protein